MTKSVRLAASTALALTLSFAISAPLYARPMTPEDLATLPRVGAPAIAPDEQSAVVGVTLTDAESYQRESALYLISLTDESIAPQRIVDADKASEHDAAYHPDGSLWFLSDRSGKEELWRAPPLPSGGFGEAIKASAVMADIAGFKLSPDGKRIAIWGDIARDCASFGCDSDGNRAAPGPGSGREYDALFVRHWDAWETPGNYSRIFAFDLVDGQLAGEGKPLDGNLTGDSPSKPFGGAEEIAWSPDSAAVIFTLRKADRDEPLSTNLDIYSAPVSKEGVIAMPGNGPATDTLPAFGNNGEQFAWAAMARPGYEADRQVLKVLDEDSPGGVRALTQDWDRSVGSIAWTKGGSGLIVTAQDVLDHPAFYVDAQNGAVARLTDGGNVDNVRPLSDGSIVYTLNSLQAPNEVYRRYPDGRTVQLTRIAADAMAAIDDVSIERFSFAGAGGAQVWGQIIKPQREGKLPLALFVHGGPQGSFGNSWSTRWNPKVIAAQGYAVVTIDFHGSTGYGQAFTDAINRDWGGKPLTDLKLGVAAALAADTQIDGNRACALGGSYGGYMMNWIAGNWPDRFDCLVNHAGVFDLRAMAFSTEELWFDQWDHGGPWWQRAEPEKWNPVNHVTKWQTPTLFIHGEKDFRIPYTQSIMPFTYMQQAGIAAKLLIYPDENHWVLKGKNSVQWYRTVLGWLDQWTKAAGDGEPPTVKEGEGR